MAFLDSVDPSTSKVDDTPAAAPVTVTAEVAGNSPANADADVLEFLGMDEESSTKKEEEEEEKETKKER